MFLISAPQKYIYFFIDTTCFSDLYSNLDSGKSHTLTFQLKSLFVGFRLRDSTFQHLNVHSVNSSVSEKPESATAAGPVICL